MNTDKLSKSQKDLAIIILQELYSNNGNYTPIRYEKHLATLKEQTEIVLELKDVRKIMLELEVLSFVEEHCCNSSYKIKPKGIEFVDSL